MMRRSVNLPLSPRVPVERHKELVQRFYDIGSPYYAEMWGEHIHDGYYITGRESRGEAQENLVKHLAAGAAIGKGDRVLDVGCGIGGSSIWLARNCGAVTVGITISPVQLKMAKKLAAERRAVCTFLLMDADEMHFDGKFDVIWAVAVCTHLPDQATFIEKATGFLNPHGRFVLFDWMLGNGEAGARADRQVNAVRRGMLLASLHTMPEYVLWFTGKGYRIVSSEDITAATALTWEGAQALVRRPAVWKFAASLGVNEGKRAIAFIHGLGAMKAAMAGGKLIAGAIIAERPD
jgi:tocopherol O-methyltransferase